MTTIATAHRPLGRRIPLARRWPTGRRQRRSIQRPSKAKSITGIMFACAIFFMLTFPKGGFKVSDIPLTIGYALVGPTALVGLYLAFRSRPSWQVIYIYLSCVALAAWSYLCISNYGGQQTGFRIAYFVSVLILPLWAALCFNKQVMKDWSDYILRAFVLAVRVVALYGIFLFLFKYATGNWIEVPYLTVNVDDAGGLDDKHINRGGIFKLISTYNNGNIFGVSMCIIAPLYLMLEKRKIFILSLAVALLLTLSRTVWIGMFIISFFHFIARGVKPIYLFYLLIGFLAFALSVYGVLVLLDVDGSFLFDSELGGRSVNFAYLTDVGVIPYRRGIDLPEIVYIGIVYNYGIIGLLLFMNMLGAPMIAHVLSGFGLFDWTKGAACMRGLLVYTILAVSDAAFNYIPVMMIFWLIAFLGLWFSRAEKAQMLGRRS